MESEPLQEPAGPVTPTVPGRNRQPTSVLPELKDIYATLLENTQDLLCTHDLQGVLLSVSPAPAQILGYDVEELLHKPFPELLAPEFRSQFDPYLAKIQKDGVANGLMTLLTRTGERRVWEYHNTLRREGLAQPIVIGFAHDVTDRVRAERALRSSEAKFRSVFRDAGAGMVIVGTDGRIVEANRSFCDFLGYSHEELSGKAVLELTHPDDVEAGSQAIGQAFSGAQRVERFEKRYLHKDGRTKWGEVSISLAHNHERSSQYLIAHVVDVTGRKRAEDRLRLKLEQTTLLWAISRLISGTRSVDHVVHAAVDGVIEHFDSNLALLFQKEGESLQLRAIASSDPQFKPDAPVAHSIGQCLCGLAARDGQPIYCVNIFDDPRCTWEECKKAGIHSFAALPLKDAGQVIGVLGVASASQRDFESEKSFLETLAAQVALALANARSYQEITRLKDKLSEEKVYLEQEIKREGHYDEIVGESKTLQSVLEQVRIVAPTDATTLILGETGVGKELIARAIHRMSERNKSSFIKLNCAAIPTGLVESELFGYERGAFTGAISKKIGRLELADQGTLFLDEVGDLPLEVQPKLLRVLQDHEFERLGGTKTVRVNVRLIAATNRDLVKDVGERRFRSDLFYRLNVFPIRLPALRERRSDIPLLVTHFVQKYAARMRKQIDKIPARTLAALTDYDWPGNIRELENFIERSVILTSGSVLEAPLAELRPETQASMTPAPETTLQGHRRDHILRALRESGGVIGGPKGAGARLGLKRTTLQSMMEKLAISPEEYRTKPHD